MIVLAMDLGGDLRAMLTLEIVFVACSFSPKHSISALELVEVLLQLSHTYAFEIVASICKLEILVSVLA